MGQVVIVPFHKINKRKEEKMKKKEIKKVLAVMLAAAMCTTACGKTDTTSGSEKKESESISSSTPATSETTEKTETKEYWQMLGEVSDTSELPDWTGDKLEVNVWFAASTDAIVGDIPATNVTFKEFERVTGVTFNVEESYGNGGEGIGAKLPKVIASKDLPNMIISYSTDAQMNDLYDNGYLLDLTEYFENGDLWGVEYWLPEEIGKDSAYSRFYASDGNIFQVPSGDINPTIYSLVDYAPEEFDAEYWNLYGNKPHTQGGTNYTSNNAFWVRDDILKAVRPEALTMAEIKEIYLEKGVFTKEEVFDIGLETVDDLYQLLRDIKAEVDTGKYVGLDGKQVEVTYGPNTETDNWDWMTMAIKWALGTKDGTDAFVWSVIDDDASTPLIQRVYEVDEAVEYMRNLNALVNEDVISKTSLVDNGTTFKEKGINGHYVVSYGNSATNAIPNDDALTASKVEYGYRPIFLSQLPSETYGGFSTGNITLGQGVAIFKDTLTKEQQDQLVHALSYLASPVGANNFMWGPASAGLFTEDADGNRTYTDPELEANIIGKKDNEAAYKYGIVRGTCTTKNLFTMGIEGYSLGYKMINPQYLAYGTSERMEADAKYYFNPGLFPEYTYANNMIMVNSASTAHGSGTKLVEGIKEWWSARPGYEKQLTKTIVAAPGEFDKELAELDAFVESVGFTDAALKEFNEKWIEANKDKLDAAGIVY